MPISVTSAWRNASDTALPTLKLLGSGYSLADFMDSLQSQINALISTQQSYDAFAWDSTTSTGLTAGFKGGYINDMSGTPVAKAAFTVTLTANQTNYIMIDYAGAVTVNTTGWLADKMPIATIVAGASSFTSGNVTDMRPFAVVIAAGKLLTSKLDSVAAQRLPTVAYTIDAEAADNIDVTVQLKDINGTNLTSRRTIEVWMADAVDGWETASAPASISVQTGTQFDVITAAKRLRVLTNTSGVAVLRVNYVGAKTWYMAVLIDNVATYSAAITFV